MKKLLCIITLLAPLVASAQLQWRLSIKLIADSNNNPAPNAAQNYTNEVTTANQLLDSFERGYRFQIAELLTLTGVSQWYNIQARNNSNKLALQAAARVNPSLYAYRNNAINVYVVNDISGVCSFPPGDDIVLVGANAYRTLLLHECGHFFNLRHTHNTERFENSDGSTCNDPSPCNCFRAFEGDDGIADTPLDNECFTRDQISSVNFNNRPYDLLNDTEKALVNNTALNIMSYHPPASLTILTSDQLDFATDASNTSRFNVATGRTRFVDRTHGGAQDGSRANPFRTVVQGFDDAAPGEIVLIRPGNYNEPRTYNKSVTFRATRGAATIGRP